MVQDVEISDDTLSLKSILEYQDKVIDFPDDLVDWQMQLYEENDTFVKIRNRSKQI